ncbi:HigA family addiction module antitoxin [Sphingomonas sp.]|jgi:addiction module HigA family antidote|uniref:HigA family addiction module antitoxin n=1 Tax=Sphingomonas sp. TaxID=28214 RepID=UPI002E34403A|nr:HigA family addiction module antitoxin [Sphingomonas sp.]HEX4694710.1 HigA family addiction module antitoxin [Sphingomonas sp.]
MTSLLKGLRPTHPGEILREDILPALGLGKAEIARSLHVSRHTLYELLAERQPVTPQMALRLGKLCGNGAEIWGRMQLAYDLATTASKMVDELSQIPTLKAA